MAISIKWENSQHCLVSSASEQVSLTLQAKNTSVQDAVNASELAIKFYQQLQTDESFNLFYDSVLAMSTNLTEEAELLRYCRPPKRFDDGAAPHKFSDSKEYFQSIYIEVLERISSDTLLRHCTYSTPYFMSFCGLFLNTLAIFS